MGYLLVLLLAIVLGLFALANPQAVPVMLWPQGWIAEVPLWQAILLPAALGFLAGALIVLGGARAAPPASHPRRECRAA
jgi:uncharacterized integral membrane protein